MAEEHEFQSPEGHILCANNCGFFGSPATSNLCSKCFRDLRMNEQQNALAKAAFDGSSSGSQKSSPLSSQSPNSCVTPSSPASLLPSPTMLTPIVASSSSPALVIPPLKLPESAGGDVGIMLKPDTNREQQQAVSKPNRCSSCRKRVGLTGFKCRCGSVFCGSHRYAEKHACSFDYKGMGKEEIAKANPVVKAAKLDKI